MKRWLVVGWLLLPSVLCAQGAVDVDYEPEPIARVIAYPKDIPALSDYEQGQAQSQARKPDESSVVRLTEAPQALPSSADGVTTPQLSPSTLISAELKVLPGRTGYAFDQPEILVRQRLFGLAHGVSLLAAACVELPEQSAATQESFMAWHAQQAAAIEQVVQDLAQYYFGPQAALAQWQDLTRALKLKNHIKQTLGQFEFSVACASLTQAITGPRYDLAALLQMEPLIAMRTVAGEVIPASAAESATVAQPPQETNAPNAANATAATSTVPVTHLVPSAATESSATPAPTEENSSPHEPHEPHEPSGS